MSLLFSNNAETTLASAVTALAQTSLVAVSDGSADMFRSPQSAMPTGFQLATLTHPSVPGDYEIVRITARAGNVFTVERAVEVVFINSEDPNPENMRRQGEARLWPAGTKLSARITAGTLNTLLAGGDGMITRPDSIVLDVTVPDYQSQAAAVDRSMVFAGRANRSFAVQLSAYRMLLMENAAIKDQYYPADQDFNMSSPSVGGTFPVDLGVPPAWAPSTYYPRGMVIVPTTPDGNQYWAELDRVDESSLWTAGTEPSWVPDPVTNGVEDGFDPNINRGRWRATAMPINFGQSLFYPLVVTEVGFIAHKVTATTTPSISIGTAADPTKFAANVALSQITGDGCVHRIPITTGGVMTRDLHYKVDTAATGGQFLGRFYWRGFFVDTWDA